jgi:5-methyltetrahydropteroyltriglutamate--homocysteine methyltransferase
MSSKPLFRAEQVGSLLRPAALIAARDQFKQGKIDARTLREREDAAIRDAVAMQERLGFQVVTDGEFRRENWWLDFISRIGGTRIEKGAGPSFKRNSDHDFKYVPLNVLTAARLSRPQPLAANDYAGLHRMTTRTGKITIPSPSRLHFHGGRNVVSKEAYPDIEVFFADLAKIYRDEIADLEAAGCRYIQIDDPLLTYFISDQMRTEVVADGETAEARLVRYVDLINACINERRPDTRVGIHLCRGNSRSGWLTEGGYERIAEATFGRLAVDTFFLEYDDARSGDFAPLRFVPKDKIVVLGLVTTKFPQLEDKAVLRKRIAEAVSYVDLDRLAISPQCGFASTVEGNLITPEVQEAKLRLIVEMARDVWGSA